MDYQNTLIYKISCKDLAITDCYVGHTTNFTLRLYNHKAHCKNEKGNKEYYYKVYEFIRSNGGWDNFEMKIIEHYPCENKGEATVKEQEYIISLNATLNCKGSVLDIENKIKTKKECDKSYRETHKELLKEKKANDYQKNKEHYTILGQTYRETHKELIKEKKANDYQKNKVYYTCDCGKEIQTRNKAKHEQSVFHIMNV